MKENENLYDIVSSLVGSGKIKSAIAYLSKVNINSDEIVLIKSRFSDLESKRIKGTVSEEYYSLQKNIISDSILGIARKKSSINDDSNKNSEKEIIPFFWMKIAIVVLVVSLTLYLVIDVKYNLKLGESTPLSDTSLAIEKNVGYEVDSNAKTDLEPSNESDVKKDNPLSEVSLPAFDFEKIEIDLGKIKAGTRIEHDIHFINSGDSPLVIQTVKGSCGCLIAKSDKSVYLPGESGILTFSLDTSNRNGKNTFKISISNNSEVNPYFLKVNSEIFI